MKIDKTIWYNNIFFSDEDYLEKNIQSLKREKQEVKNLSVKLCEKLSAYWQGIKETENFQTMLWDYLVCSKEYMRLKEIHTQLEEDGIIVYGDYYFEQVSLPHLREIYENLKKEKYKIGSWLPPEPSLVSLRDLNNTIHEKFFNGEKRSVSDQTVSIFDPARKFIEKELGIRFDQVTDRKGKYEFLKIVNLLYQYSSDLQYLRIASVKRIEVDLINTPTAYHKLLAGITQEVMKEILPERLCKIVEEFFWFYFFENELEKYAIQELASSLDIAAQTDFQYAIKVFNYKNDRVINALNKNEITKLEGINKRPVFEQFYIKTLLWKIENQYYLTQGCDRIQITRNPGYIKKMFLLKCKIQHQFPLKEISSLVTFYSKEIAEVVFGDSKPKYVKRVTPKSAIKKYEIVARMIFELRKNTTNHILSINELIAIIQIVEKIKNKDNKISDESFGEGNVKDKSLKSIIREMINQYKDQKQILTMSNYRFFWILHDMVEDQIMVNCGVEISTTKSKELIRRLVFRAYLNEVNGLMGCLGDEEWRDLLSSKARKIKNDLFQAIWG